MVCTLQTIIFTIALLLFFPRYEQKIINLNDQFFKKDFSHKLISSSIFDPYTNNFKQELKTFRRGK